jgi:hypothetical protein
MCLNTDSLQHFKKNKDKMTELLNRQKIEREYIQCTSILTHTGILEFLPISKNIGVIGIDGKEYPIPGQEQVTDLVVKNKKRINKKILQGFNQLVLIPFAISLPVLIESLETTILRHAKERSIFRTRHSASDPPLAIPVNKTKQVWIWETLRQAINASELIYFPKEYSGNHRGQTKLEVIRNSSVCVFPGWSVGLIESFPLMPGPGRGKTIGGRRQLETGSSPNEYLQILKLQAYEGETGKTLEDFIIKFLTHLEKTNEVSHDADDDNALWCLGQYMKVSYAELVPTGRWFRRVGRVRLDMHRTNNKRCTKSWGASTMVRLY